MSIEDIRGRVSSLCADLGMTPSAIPWSFERTPTGVIDQAFRIESEQGQVVGWFDYVEERTDLVRVWVARKMTTDAQTMYDRLLSDVSSLRAAVIRDGLSDGGDYFVPDGGSAWDIQAEAGREFAVLRLTLPVNYEIRV